MKRPVPVTAIGWTFILVGVAGLLKDLWPLATARAAEQLAQLRSEGWADLGPAWGLRVLAIVGGVGLLRGQNWARWLLAIWMLAHIAISLYHDLTQVVVHTALFAVLAFLLFRSTNRAYFHGQTNSVA